MAKIEASIVQLTGKVDNKVLSKTRYGYHSREHVIPDPTNNSKDFKHQSGRTESLNHLASALNKVVEHYCGTFKPADFYRKMLKRLRKEKVDNRFLLLRQLHAMDVHPTNTFMKLGACRTIVTATKSSIKVDLRTTVHPYPGAYRADAYYYDVIMIVWNKNACNNDLRHFRQRTEHIDTARDSILPEFDFNFTRPAGAEHWLLCLRQQLVVNGERVEAFAGEAMQVIEAGTFNKKDEELLAKKIADENAMKTKTKKKEEEEVVVVKARKKAKAN